jgi:predicted Zn-dependent protease
LERGRTAQAKEAFQRAVNLAPKEIQPHLCLGESLMKMSMFLLEGPTPENTAAAKSAEKEFQRVLVGPRQCGSDAIHCLAEVP